MIYHSLHILMDFTDYRFFKKLGVIYSEWIYRPVCSIFTDVTVRMEHTVWSCHQNSKVVLFCVALWLPTSLFYPELVFSLSVSLQFVFSFSVPCSMPSPSPSRPVCLSLSPSGKTWANEPHWASHSVTLRKHNNNLLWVRDYLIHANVFYGSFLNK